MIFPNLHIEKVLQVDDRTRINARKSYCTVDNGGVTQVYIRPEASADYIEVGKDRDDSFDIEQSYLDFQYSSEGPKIVSLRVITDDNTEAIIEKTIDVITSETDALFSDDDNLFEYESDIYRYLRAGRNSFLDKHRTARDEIVRTLDEMGVRNVDYDKIGNDAIIDRVALVSWSAYYTLSLIFEENINQTEDICIDKAKKYASLSNKAQASAVLRVDVDGDGGGGGMGGTGKIIFDGVVR